MFSGRIDFKNFVEELVEQWIISPKHLEKTYANSCRQMRVWGRFYCSYTEWGREGWAKTSRRPFLIWFLNCILSVPLPSRIEFALAASHPASSLRIPFAFISLCVFFFSLSKFLLSFIHTLLFLAAIFPCVWSLAAGSASRRCNVFDRLPSVTRDDFSGFCSILWLYRMTILNGDRWRCMMLAAMER